MVQLSDLTVTDEVFTHVCPIDGTSTTYSVRALQRIISEATDGVMKAMVPVDQPFAEFCQENRGASIKKAKAMPPEVLAVPVIFVFLPKDQTHLLVDGHHRYIRAAADDSVFIEAFIVDAPVWEPAVVTDMPQFSDAEVKSDSFGNLRVLR